MKFSNFKLVDHAKKDKDLMSCDEQKKHERNMLPFTPKKKKN